MSMAQKVDTTNRKTLSLSETADSVVFLDIDRTCLDTDCWLVEVARYIAQHYPRLVADPEDFLRGRRAFYRTPSMSQDLPYYYDLPEHIASYGVKPERVITELMASDVADGRLQYAGLDDLVQALYDRDCAVYALTYGDDKTQRLKISMCPALSGVDCITTLDRKSTAIKHCVQYWQATGHNPLSLYMVDDKPGVGYDIQRYNDSAQTSSDQPIVHFVQVDHRPPGEVQPADDKHRPPWLICHTLNEVKTIILQGDN